MIVSAELRWFWQGAAPPSLRRWFAGSGCPPGGGKPREDVYLLDPAQAEVGLKHRARNGAVEIKGLVRRAEQPLAAGPFAGHIEIWSKWTSEALRLDGLPSLVVHKVRRLRKLDTGSAHVSEIALGADESPLQGAVPDEGCNLELTEVSVPGHRGSWATLGFESFGTLERVEVNLERAVGHLLGSGVPEFPHGIEQSYPAWIRARRDG
ncbi:MAG TPA: hypothetical protein VFV75_13055 [Candidatus Polarisedimenticolaceae bacterium]|nr:hypothetical protein [Candidatus Polarisedimenticolaceae bacterium]